MKVLLINGSPKANGNTAIALQEMVKVFEQEGMETEILHIGNKDIRGCISCNSCANSGKCVFDDVVNELALKFREADGMVVASPVYYASANATLIAVLDRLFYSTGFDKRMKVGASIAIARRTSRIFSLWSVACIGSRSGSPSGRSLSAASPSSAVSESDSVGTVRFFFLI